MLQSGFHVKDPLVGPVAAIASGILVSRFVPFHQFELLAAIAAFLLLGILAVYRNARFLAGALLPVGAVLCGRADRVGAYAWSGAHAGCRRPRGGDPGRLRGGASGHFQRARALPAGPRSGCARAGDALHEERWRGAAGSAIRAEDRTGRTRAQAAKLRQSGRLRLRALPGAPGHLLDRLGRGGERPDPAGALRIALRQAGDESARRHGRADRPDVGRQQLPGRHDAGRSAGPDLPDAACVDGGLSQYRHLSRAGDFGHARGNSGGVLSVYPARLLRAGKSGTADDGCWRRGCTRWSADGDRRASARRQG